MLHAFNAMRGAANLGRNQCATFVLETADPATRVRLSPRRASANRSFTCAGPQ